MPLINNIRELNERVSFYKLMPGDGPDPNDEEEKMIFSCWAKVRTAYIKDVKAATGTDYEGTLEIVVRYQQEESIDTKMVLEWKNKKYNIVKVNPDYAEKNFTVLVVKARN